MIDLGVFAVYRGIWDHPIFAKEPLTEREAWLWMVGEAAWKPTTVRVGLYSVPVARGQLAHSTRFLAERFLWPEIKVRRFLKRLVGDAMLITSVTRKVTHLTICNYDKYSFDGRKVDAPSVSKVAQIREEEITKKRKKDGAEAPPSGGLFGDIQVPQGAKARLFARGRELLGKSAGATIKDLLKAKNENPHDALAVLEKAAGTSDPKSYVYGAINRRQSNGITPNPEDPNSYWDRGI